MKKLFPILSGFLSLLVIGSPFYAYAAQRHILIDYGSPNSLSPAYDGVSNLQGWNNLTVATTGSTIANLKDSLGNDTGMSMTVTDSFWQQAVGLCNQNGTKSSTVYPDSATQDSFFIGLHDGFNDDTAAVRFAGLLADKKYKIRLYSSRMTSDLTSDRTTVYTINGVSKELQVRNNIDNLVEFPNLSASSGTIDVNISLKPGAIYGYLGVAELVENSIPVANAGADKTLILPASSVTLNGSATDSDGSIVSYSWTKVSGGAVTMSASSSASCTMSGLVAGIYTFRLTVTDNDGATDSDDVVVTVKTNTAPVANAGADTSIQLPTSSVALKGFGTDSDGTISKYAWTQIAGASTATLSSPSSASCTMGGLITAGSYAFRLTVTDNGGATAYDDVNVNVLAAANVAPKANAGADKLITLPTSSVTLSGAGSDTDGTIAKYAWSKISGAAVTFGSPSSASTTVSGLTAGSYVFRLTVTDNAGATGYDDVAVVVNSPPVANAGADKTISLPTNSVTLSGSATDSDGTIASYSWSKISGSTAVFSSTSTSTTTISSLVAGSYTFRLTVKDNRGATDTDDVIVTVKSTTVTTQSAPVENIRPLGSVSGANYGYIEYLPEGYAQSGNWPIIIFLHGVGQTNYPDANGVSKNLGSVAPCGPNGYASPKHGNHKLPFVILQPQSPGWWNEYEVDKFRAFAFNRYKVDPKRFYITGLSMGGGGVCNYLNAFSKYPAAGMPIAPAGKISGTGATNIVNNKVAVWGVHCINDGRVTNLNTRVSFGHIGQLYGGPTLLPLPTFSTYPALPNYAAKSAHFDTNSHNWVYIDGQKDYAGVPPYFVTIYSNGGHGGWDRMYTNAYTYTWFLKHTK